MYCVLMKDDKLVTITVRIPKEVYDRMEELVNNAIYASKSHLARRAIIDYLNRNHPVRSKILA